MNNIRAGMSLIEFMIYLAMISMISMTCFMWVTHVGFVLAGASKYCNQLSAAHVARELFARDIRFAPSEVIAWKKLGDNELVWHANNEDVSWLFDGGELIRIIGEYDSITGTWNKRKKSIACTGVDSTRFMFERVNTHIKKITIMFTACAHGRSSLFVQEVALRNRVV